MTAKLLGIGVLALGCVVAAGTGAYLAVRQNAATATAGPDVLTSSSTAAPLAGEVALAVTAPGEAPGVPATPADVRPAASPAPGAVERQAEKKVQPPRKTPRSDTQVRAQAAAPPPEPAPPVERPPEPASMPAVFGPPPLPTPLVPVEEPPAPPAPQIEEVVVPADAVIGLRVENSVSSETARVEDGVTARVTRDVRVAGQVAIPAGSRVQGSVVVVVRGGKFKERARLGVRFHTLITDAGTVPLQSEVVFREGESKTAESAAKMSAGAIGGAIIGAIVGGGKGAAIGSAAGAGAGTAAVAAGDRSEAVLAAGSNVTVRLSQPVVITVER